jgi:hypothetical protein
MNRREIAVNVLLGFLLLLIFAFLFAAGIGAIGFSLTAMHLAAKHFFPELTRSSDVGFYAFLGLAALISGIAHLRNGLCRNAFLSVSAFAMTLFLCSAGANAAFAPDGTFGMFAFVAILSGIPTDRSLSRSRFLSTSSMIAVLIAVSSGLLGSGPLARIVGDVALVAVFIRFLFDLRQTWATPIAQIRKRL